MINRIYAYLAAAGVILLALIGIHRSGKREGRAESEARSNEQALRNLEAHNAEIKRHQEVIARNATTTRDDVINSLRDREF